MKDQDEKAKAKTGETFNVTLVVDDELAARVEQRRHPGSLLNPRGGRDISATAVILSLVVAGDAELLREENGENRALHVALREGDFDGFVAALELDQAEILLAALQARLLERK